MMVLSFRVTAIKFRVLQNKSPVQAIKSPCSVGQGIRGQRSGIAARIGGRNSREYQESETDAVIFAVFGIRR
jgi:hypothetical protein